MNTKFKLTVLLLLISLKGFTISTPVIRWPTNNITYNGFSIYLDLDTVATATGYQFCLDTTATLNSAWRVFTTTNNKYIQSPDLWIGKSYWWKARAFKPGDTSAWTSVTQFTIGPPLPISAMQPQSGKSGTISSFEVLVYDKTENIVVQYELDTVATMNSPLHRFGSRHCVNGETWTAKYQDSVVFDFGRKIYWRARACGPYGDTTAWSPIANYTIIGTTPNHGGDQDISPKYILYLYDFNLAGTELQLDTSLAFNSSRLIQHSLSPGIKYDTLTDLLFGKSYYVRIRQTWAGKVSAWSNTGNYKVREYAYINTPNQYNQPNYSVNGYCAWQGMSGVLNQFGLYEDNAYTIPVVDTITKASSYTYHKMLRFGKKYYVRVRAMHAKDTCHWDYRSFIVTDGAPIYSGVLNNDTNVSVRPPLSFSKISYATKYVLEIDTGSVFPANHSSHYMYIDSFKYNGNNFYLDTLLLYNQKYTTRLRLFTTDDTSAYRYITFRTASAPVNHFPPNNFIGLGTSSGGLVTGIKGSTLLEWEIDTSLTFSSPYFQTSTNQHLPDKFSPEYVNVEFPDYFKFHTTYYWRTRCISAVDTSDWSAPFNFLTTQEVWAFSPADGAKGQPINPVLEWGIQGSSSYQDYQYMFSTDSNFTGAAIVTLHPDSLPRVKVNCNYSTTYYWKARVINPIDTSHWSPRFSFTTSVPPAVNTPLQLLPYHTSTNVNAPSVTFKWNQAKNAVTYEVQLSDNAGFTNILVNPTTSSTTWNFQDAKPLTRYYWRVRGISTYLVKSNWSETWWFETAQPTGVQEIDLNILATIYPNPAASAFTVKYPEAFDVELRNIEGQMVGAYSGKDVLPIPTLQLSNGIYFVTIRTNEATTTRKLVIHH